MCLQIEEFCIQTLIQVFVGSSGAGVALDLADTCLYVAIRSSYRKFLEVRVERLNRGSLPCISKEGTFFGLVTAPEVLYEAVGPHSGAPSTQDYVYVSIHQWHL